MALTPTTLIAIAGLSQGSGLAINSNLTSLLSQITTNSMISSIVNLRTAPNIGNVGGFDVANLTISSLPSVITQSNVVADTVRAQALAIMPATTVTGLKDFIQILGAAASYSMQTAEVAGAVSQFKNQTFGNLGVGVTNYSQLVTSGIPATLIATGPYLKNFGTLYDFTDLTTVGTAQNLIKNLIAQGYDSYLGISNLISYQGFSVGNIKMIPDKTLEVILSQIQGNQLQYILDQTGATVVAPVSTMFDLLKIQKFFPPDIITTSGYNSISALANGLINLGMAGTNITLGSFLSSIEAPSLPHLNTLTEVLPATVVAQVSSLLGTGNGTFNNPTLSDIIGTAAGIVHTTSLLSVTTAISTISANTLGQTLTSTATALRSALVLNADTTAANIAFYNAVQAVNSAALGRNWSATISSANTGMAASLAQVNLENTNLTKAAIPTYASGPTTDGTTGSDFISFGGRLQNFGQDSMKIGYNAILTGMTTDDQAGEAIKAALAEGRNIASSQKSGKTTPHLADFHLTLAAQK